MPEDEERGEDGPGQDLDGFSVGNVSEFFYAGRPAVIVRTTHLQGSDEERDVRRGLRRVMHVGRTAGLRA